MSNKSQFSELATLKAEMIADIEALSDADLLREAQDSGEDAEKLANEVRAGAREAVATVLRAGLAQAKAASVTPRDAPSGIRPALEQLKTIVKDALKQQPDAALAFRDGKMLSDNDWQTLYDDLVLLGAIKPDADAD